MKDIGDGRARDEDGENGDGERERGVEAVPRGVGHGGEARSAADPGRARTVTIRGQADASPRSRLFWASKSFNAVSTRRMICACRLSRALAFFSSHQTMHRLFFILLELVKWVKMICL